MSPTIAAVVVVHLLWIGTWLAMPYVAEHTVFWWPVFGVSLVMGAVAVITRSDLALAGTGLAASKPPEAAGSSWAREAMWGIGSGIVLTGLSHVGVWVAIAVVPSLQAHIEGLYTKLYSAPGPVGAIYAFLTIIVVEGLVWRGLVQGWLEERAPAGQGRTLRPVLLTTVLYMLATAAQLDPLLAAVAGGVGLCWSWLRAHTGGVLAPILSHVVWDVGVMILFPLV